MTVTRLRVLALVHRHLIPPDTLDEGTDIVSAPWRTEYDVISTLRAMGHDVQALGVHDDLGEIRRRGDRVEAAHRLQPARRIRRHRDLRPERRLAPGAVEAAVHRLQSARAAARARQVAVEEAPRLPPHCGARVRGVPRRTADSAAEAAVLSADREVADAGSLHRDLAGVGGRQRREAEGARRVHSREHRHGGDRRAVHRGARAVRRHPRQPDAAVAAGLGAVLLQHAARGASASRPTA